MTNAPRLPPDVIREILSHAAPSGAPTGTDSAYEREPYGVPWELALVDQSWRQCAIESRSLRTCLTLDGADFTDPEALARLECQLERSSSKTLDVSLSGSQPFEILRASPAFLASCSRWETLLVRPEPDASFDDLGLADGKFTMLRRLEFVCAGEELESTLDEFSNAGSLREVILTDKDFEFPSPEVDLPWQQITHLRAFYDSHQAFLVVAEETVNLVDLALHIDPNAPAVIASTVALPKLRHLYAHVSECLSSFIAPALCELTCSAARPFGVHSFCARGNILSSLCSLTLLGFTGSPDEIWGILLDFTALKHLAIESVAFPTPPQPGIYTPTRERRLFRGLTAARNIARASRLLCIAVWRWRRTTWKCSFAWFARDLAPSHPQATMIRGVACATSASSG